MLEENFITSMIKSRRQPRRFFSRPIALASLAVVTLLVWTMPVVMKMAAGGGRAGLS
jgi:TctA family transporter